MNKLFQLIEENAIKIIVTVALAWGLFFGLLYIQGIQKDVSSLKEQVTVGFSAQDDKTMLVVQGLMVIIQQLEDLAQSNSYIIDQNRERAEKVIVESNNKPTYEEIRSHSVWIEGCAGGADHDDEISFPVGDAGASWGGTGVIIKVTETETYILTNNHVSGRGEDKVKLYVENDVTHKLVPAEIVAQHLTVDAAVIKIKGALPNKKAIPGIATAHVQDPVYVVGNPLGVRDVYSEGIVAGYEGVSMLLQMPCIFGNSGSGVFNQEGKLVGLVFALEMYHGWMGIPEARITHSLVVDSVSIRMFLKDLGLYE